MAQKIKEFIQEKLNNRRFEKFEKELECQKDSYRQWYLLKEDWRNKQFPKPTPKQICLVPAQKLVSGFIVPQAQILVFADERGELESQALPLIADFFSSRPWVSLAYSDEDRLDENGKRIDPWFKPEWSPDTFDCFQYMGHLIAVKQECVSLLTEAELKSCLMGDYEQNLYQFLLLITKRLTKKNWIFANAEKKEIAVLDKVLIHMKEEIKDQEGTKESVMDVNGSVSVIIPSKDNVSVLNTCISSIREKTLTDGNFEYEILVVDNGSSESNRKLLEKLSESLQFTYLYEPMPFNFSKMCNLGIRHSKGDYCLLLNDDMEIIQPDWMLKLLEKASLPHAGAVGAKLLYPDSDVIQHIGVTNIKVGPVHKLLKQSDAEWLYHGQNKHVYDMLAVTAACLLVKKEKLLEAGGLYEEMAVAYNDVDFCFTLHDLGYYNIQRNDVILFHHESLSRGDDNLSDEKWIRLLKEKDILYQRHPSLKSKDPFYSRNLAVHSNLYLSNFMYPFEMRDYYTKVRRFGAKEPVKWLNGCLVVNVEHCRQEKKLEFTERDDVYWIEGWSYVMGMDNCRYKRKLLLQGEKGNSYILETLDRYRKDVADILPEQKNVELSGFVCRIPRELLPEGHYKIGMIAVDTCSGQRLYTKDAGSFTVEK